MANPILFGKYHLIEKISAGGMAEVYKAKSYGVAGFEKILVIKKILPHLTSDPEFVNMFLDEARISVSLSHGNIVQVIDLGKEGDTYFMAMEYVQGYDLARTLVKGRQGEEPPRALCIYILCEVLKALDYAHRRKDRQQKDLNIVHCDVSPQNVLLSFEGEVKLTDFGISKAAFQSASSQGVVRGKYAYMSPEQVQGEPLDRRSDIFSVGVILWEILTHKRLFKTESVEKTLRKVLSGVIQPPSTLDPDIPQELDRITFKALARNRNERYQEDQDMLEDLLAFAYSQGYHAGATELADYLRKLFKRELSQEQSEDKNRPLQDRNDKEREANRKRTMFIPVGSTRTISSYQPDLPGEQGASLARVGVAVCCAEWNMKGGAGAMTGEQGKVSRDLMNSLERVLLRQGGELWEVNHNSLVAVWRIRQDPVAMTLAALDTCSDLREEFDEVVEKVGGGWTIDLALHVGTVIVDKRTGNPLLGWQITRTFAVARLLTNLILGSDLFLVSGAARQLLHDRIPIVNRDLPGQSAEFLLELGELPRVASGAARPRYALYTRLVGRDAPLSQLEARLREASQGRPAVVALAGEEGAGRGRLKEALLDRARPLGAAFFVGHAYGSSRYHAYAPVLDALRAVCGLAAPEPVSDERSKLGRLIQLGLSQEDLEIVNLLFDEPDVPFAQALDPTRQARLFAVFDKVFFGLAKDAVLVLAFERLQDADPLTESYLGHLVKVLNTQKILLVLEVPPSYDRPFMHGPVVSVLDLEPLVPALVDELAREVLGVRDLAPRLQRALMTRAGGNPLFVKELIAWLIDEDHLEIKRRAARLVESYREEQIPHTLPEVMARRFSLLPDATRRTLKVAAIVGPAFSLAALESLLQESGVASALQIAVQSGWLEERAMGTLRMFHFRHAHGHFLAMTSRIAPTGAAVRRKLLPQLKRLLPRGNLTEELASQAVLARLPEAHLYLEKAGDKLLREQEIASSLVFYRKGLELCEQGGGKLMAHARRLRWKTASALLQQGLLGGSDDLLQEWLSAARQSGMTRQTLELMTDLAQQCMIRGEFDPAFTVLREALSMAQQTGEELQIAEVERAFGRTLQAQGRLEDALPYLCAGYQRARARGERGAVLPHALGIGEFYHQIGYFGRALDSFRRVLTAARETNDAQQMLLALIALGELHTTVRREKLALKCFKEALTLARSLDDRAAQSTVLGLIGALCLEQGAPQRAQPYLKAGADLSAPLNRPDLNTDQRLSLAFSRALVGEARDALRDIHTIMSRPETGRLRQVVARAHLLSGRCQLMLRETRRAKEAFERSLAVARELQSEPLARLASSALSNIPATQLNPSLEMPVSFFPERFSF